MYPVINLLRISWFQRPAALCRQPGKGYPQKSEGFVFLTVRSEKLRFNNDSSMGFILGSWVRTDINGMIDFSALTVIGDNVTNLSHLLSKKGHNPIFSPYSGLFRIKIF